MSEYILPKIGSSTKFENLICDLFNALENTSSYKTNIDYQLFGRAGQNQKGIDIFSQTTCTVIQCKVKKSDSVTTRTKLLKEISDDLKKMQDIIFPIKRVVFASTFSDDAIIQEYLAQMVISHNFSFNAIYWGWDTITKYLQDYDLLQKKYFPKYFHLKEPKIITLETIPEDALGSHTIKYNYINYLIKRYGDWKQIELNRTREKFNWGRFKKQVNDKYKIPKLKYLPLSQFEILAKDLQMKIDNTVFGRNRKKKGYKNYSLYEEFERGIF